MMEVSTNLGNELGKFLDLSTQQVQITSANMANIDTPGYKALGIDFEGEMRKAILVQRQADPESTLPSNPSLFQVNGLLVRPDGNNVSMDRESLVLAETQLKFKVGVSLLRHEFTRISDAIHSDAK